MYYNYSCVTYYVVAIRSCVIPSTSTQSINGHGM